MSIICNARKDPLLLYVSYDINACQDYELNDGWRLNVVGNYVL